MGSTLMTQKEAAAFLERSDRMIRKYVKQRLLHTEKRGRRSLLFRAEVEQLAMNLKGGVPMANRVDLSNAARRFEALEKRVTEALKELKGEIEDKCRPDSDMSSQLVQFAQATMGLSAWSLGDMQFWANTLLRFDEITLEKIGHDLGTDRPWSAFLKLAEKMYAYLSSHAALKNDLGLQSVQHNFDTIRRRLRGYIGLWYEMGRLKLPPGLADGAPESPIPLSPKEKMDRMRAAALGGKS